MEPADLPTPAPPAELGRLGDAAPPKALADLGKALMAEDRFDDALAVFVRAATRWPHRPVGWLGIARLAITDGRHLLARDAWRHLVETFPGEALPKWHHELGRAELALGELDAAAARFARLRADHPDQPFGWQGARRVAERRKDDTAIAAWKDETARRGWPDAADGRSPVAEARRIERDAGGPAACAYLAALPAAERGLKTAVEELKLQRRTLTRAADLPPLRAAAHAALRRWPQRSHAVAEAAAALIAGNDPAAPGLAAREAARLEGHGAGLPVLAWAAAQIGDDHAASALYARHLGRTYVAALSGPCTALRRIRGAPAPARAPVCLATVLRDEASLLPAFFAHYRGLGIERFVVVDNGSCDGTFEWLLAQPDVELWHCPAGFRAAQGGMRWINHLLEGMEAAWMLYVDVDELVVLPPDTRDLPAFVRRLDEAGWDAAAGFMLDMHPRCWRDLAAFAPGGDPLAACPFFTCDHFAVGDTMSPWFDMVGGVRARRFGTSEKLRKVPFLRVASGGRYLDSHSTTPVRTVRNAFALLHFKMVKEVAALRQAGDDRLDGRSAGSRARHARFAGGLAATPDDDLGGTRFEGWASLAALPPFATGGAGTGRQAA